MIVQDVVVLLVRLGLVALFLPASAFDKVFNFRAAATQAREVFRPRALAAATIVAGLSIEILMPLLILTGFADRFAALVLSGYCVATALLFKRFWRHGDFWKAGDSQGRTLFWDFLKNLSLASGFLLLTVGPDGAGLQPFLAHPFASSDPYASNRHGS